MPHPGGASLVNVTVAPVERRPRTTAAEGGVGPACAKVMAGAISSSKNKGTTLFDMSQSYYVTRHRTDPACCALSCR
jgi:hypothetical protein